VTKPVTKPAAEPAAAADYAHGQFIYIDEDDIGAHTCFLLLSTY
jgi:hypothetical protein